MEVLPFWIGLISGSIIASIILITSSIVGFYRYKEKYLRFFSRIDEEFKRNINARVTGLENIVFNFKDKGD